jgi:hypothetical protein
MIDTPLQDRPFDVVGLGTNALDVVGAAVPGTGE